MFKRTLLPFALLVCVGLSAHASEAKVLRHPSYHAGMDAQIEKAVEVLKEELKKKK